MKNNITKKTLDELTFNVIGAAIEIHRELGPGLLESIYYQCLGHELNLRRINFVSEFIVPIAYIGVEYETNLRCDFLIENCLVVELKSIENIMPIHEAQLMTYMKLLQVPKGILVNFNVTNIFKEGQKTYVNEIFRNIPDL